MITRETEFVDADVICGKLPTLVKLAEFNGGQRTGVAEYHPGDGYAFSGNVRSLDDFGGKEIYEFSVSIPK